MRLSFLRRNAAEKDRKLEEVNLLAAGPGADELRKNDWNYQDGNLAFAVQLYQLRS